MTVLVSKDPRRYQSIGLLGSSEDERRIADELDELLKVKIEEVAQYLKENELFPEDQSKANVITYWTLGSTLREVVTESGLLKPAELPLFWNNVKIYLPEELLYKDRGPYREHLWYCYRLSSYGKELIEKMNWGEWVTIFDSTAVNQECRFDIWFNQKLVSLTEKIKREQIRIFIPLLNIMLKNIDVQELNDEELINCYDGAWGLMTEVHQYKEGREKVDRQKLQNAISNNLILVDKLMGNSIAKEDFVLRILENCKK
jgi:hypothetical protein